MTPEQAKSMYRRQIGNFETVTLRIYTGTTEAKNDYDVAARVMGADGSELVGAIGQRDVKLILLHDDLVTAGYPLPIQSGANYKAMVRGRELQIKPPVDDNTRRLAGQAIAYDIVAGG